MATGDGSGQGGPVFVCGSARTGTTILFGALTRHPNLKPVEFHDKEVWFYDEFFRGRPAVKNRQFGLDKVFEAEAIRFIHGFMSRHCGGPGGRYVTAHPANVHHIPVLHEHLPEARFVLVLRHPQEVVWSKLHHPTARQAGWRAPSSSPDDPITDDEVGMNTREWVRSARMTIRALDGEFGGCAHVVRHEEMVARPSETMRHILDFIGEPHVREAIDALSLTLWNSSFAANTRLSAREQLKAHFDRQRATVAGNRHFCDVVRKVAAEEMTRLGYADYASRRKELSAAAAAAGPQGKAAAQLPAVELAHAVLANERGSPAARFGFGERMRLRVAMRANRPAENLSVSFRVADRDNRHLFGTTTFDENVPLPSLDAGGSLEVEFAFRQVLRPGNYRIHIDLNSCTTRDYTDIVLHQTVEDACGFVAMSDPSRPVHYAFDNAVEVRLGGAGS
jgi:hypothetical protein